MNKLERITKMIFNAIDVVNERLPETDQVEKAENGVLYAQNGKLDSLKLVQLIVIVEQRIDDEFGVAVSLADEKAVSETRSPFTTVRSFAEFIARRLEELSYVDRN